MSGFVYSQEESAVGPVMKLFQSGRLPLERQGTVVEMICSRGNANDLRVIFDRVVAPDGLPPELRRKALDWLAIAAATRKVSPAGELDAINELIIASDSPMQLSAIRAAAAWKLKSASAALQSIATGAISQKPFLQKVEGQQNFNGLQSKAWWQSVTQTASQPC